MFQSKAVENLSKQQSRNSGFFKKIPFLKTVFQKTPEQDEIHPLSFHKTIDKKHTTLSSTAQTLATHLPQLIIQSQKIARSFMLGHHGYRQSGYSQQFWQYRQACPGDPFHTIDWRQSAKSDKIFIKETERENAQTFYLWCDNSGSMQWRSRQTLPTKQERAILFSLILGYLFLHHDEQVKILVPGQDHQQFFGKQKFFPLSQALIHHNPKEKHPFPTINQVITHGWFIYISDFLFSLDGLFQSLQPLVHSPNHIVFIQVFDPAEADFPYAGSIEFNGLEQEKKLTLSITRKHQKHYTNLWSVHQKQLRDYCQKNGILLLNHKTKDTMESILHPLWKQFASKR